MKLKIKKGSSVQVIAGADKGKKGNVLEVDPKKMRVRVEGVRVQTHFDRKDGIKKVEGLIHYSNLKLVAAAPPAKAKSPRKKSSATASA